MIKFICFGSGSSGNCYLLLTEESGIMIDAGVGARALKKHFKDRGISLNRIKHILVTHDHADHIKSVGALSSELGVAVYATEKVHEGIKQNFVVRSKVKDENIRFIEKDATIHLDDFEITPFSVPHDSQDNVGYCIKNGNVTFCLMTDAGYVTDKMCHYISEANYLVLEANHDKEMLRNGHYPDFLKQRIASQTGHLSNMDCGKAVAENATPKLKHLWLCHLSEENNHPELARKTVESILASYGIVADKDFRLEILKRRTPSQMYDLGVRE
ncbi:MAG: MBL fold metallo-hydrolase [Prevotellaceae bacterium]|nr:MBL fold metallo-hydrolase [Prevotellaceae bacterium]